MGPLTFPVRGQQPPPPPSTPTHGLVSQSR